MQTFEGRDLGPWLPNGGNHTMHGSELQKAIGDDGMAQRIGGWRSDGNSS